MKRPARNRNAEAYAASFGSGNPHNYPWFGNLPWSAPTLADQRRNMKPYRYQVDRDIAGFHRTRFEITLYAGDDRAAEIIAAEIGQSLGIMLLGPI
jgi:hypothetical protein